MRWVSNTAIANMPVGIRGQFGDTICTSFRNYFSNNQLTKPPIFTMKKLFFSLFLSLATIVAFAQSPIDGNWKGSRETPNGTFDVNYTFKVEGNKLTGAWKTQFGESALQEGTVDGKKISFSISFNDRKMSY